MQYISVIFVTGSNVSTEVNVQMLIEQNEEKISPSEQLRVTFEVPPGYTNLSKEYPEEAVIVIQSKINTTAELCRNNLVYIILSSLNRFNN